MKWSIWMVAPLAAGVLSTTSCNILEDNAQYIAPFAAEIVLLNVPTDTLAEYGIEAPSVASITVALGHLTNPGTASNSPFSGEGVAGATVTVTSPEGTFTLKADTEPGIYLFSSEDDANFKYTVGAEYAVNISYNTQSYWSKFTAHEAITLTQPTELGQYHAPGTDLTVAWTPPSDTAVVAMFDETGAQIYDNIPRDLNGLYTFLTQSEVSSTVISGDKFKDGDDTKGEHVYGIGVAGLYRTAVDENHFSTNLNWLVSNAVTGTAVMSVVTTIQVPEIPGE